MNITDTSKEDLADESNIDHHHRVIRRLTTYLRMKKEVRFISIIASLSFLFFFLVRIPQ